ncbi:glycerophosphocholine phosphodiesterase GPCPD1 [Sitodiplosis mosellana]|uniref:glycerophosphocholine phosphodiesterase GPCPD1 n=1 Tax=Sitodiplosis mosellana TaxID=263140 RepID=UPI0024443BE2|nr:glycerophosphocholine phosphodiesterase GPCPD1 [Sitodiplosis mosellana]XP_055295431.1 glycerophosphocholine phosphodiesterase GPCPD1 [Sitodiplosis mosellana]XP_055295433.1 glycerophosphocholine phosphodiesterase GPCPD1 [Sitodiplosis mosellana]XP_055295434.1 glycerophosphocholine phosphodiesterase GPCPD1 [Sitodiplosis mosellana]XP_055295435.1 glycerophosphocholine phosphodiesterase GPCPD1 [Sitodiplosis mosellana]XP_055295436.1 glycerophosphocholine phosphodiesterase GPCPD1 [Sitodiplosis mose
MQRWLFGNNSEAISAESSQGPANGQTLVGNDGRLHTFRVLVNQHLEPGERVAVTGECSSLGRWLPAHCVQLNRENDSNVWSRGIYIPANKDVPYRYLVCTVDPMTENVHVRRWETHLNPRLISADHGEVTEIDFKLSPVAETAVPKPSSPSKNNVPGIDTFGDINGVEKIDRGWLTTETVFQFKFIRNPFILKQKLKNRLLYVKLTPMNLRINSTESSAHGNLFEVEDSLSNDTRENGGTEQPVYAFAEVATLKSTSNVFEPQNQFGRPYHTDDIMIFNVSVGDPENVAFLIDLYTYSSRVSPDDNEPPHHLGYHYILPNVLRKSDGKIEIPITCATKHRPLGMMNIEYIRISPLNSSVQLNMKRSFCRHWNKRWTGLDVGHRGAGTSFKPTSGDDAIRENTIASLRRAGDAGADMVEFDVQLSKDLVPVIYHDFHVYVSLKKKRSLDENDYLELPMNELTLDQLNHLKVYHQVEGKTRQPKFFDEHLDEHQPFPPLSDVFDALDESVGFNIEIKWNMELHDGRHEMDRVNKNPNVYLDCILDVVLSKAGDRRVVFSCFDPDICTMLRKKQNLYPVMFLSQGISDRYESFHDPRGDTIANAVFHANSNELLGIVAHTMDLLRDTNQLNLATDLGLIVFCWGDENNCKETIKFLKELNIHGIIYDKMDKLTEKNEKRSIFYVEGKESQKDILRLRQLEQAKHDHSSTSMITESSSSFNESANSLANGATVRIDNN